MSRFLCGLADCLSIGLLLHAFVRVLSGEPILWVPPEPNSLRGGFLPLLHLGAVAILTRHLIFD